MGMPKSAKRIAAEKFCEKFPDAPSRTLAQRVVKEFGGTIEAARNLVRTARGNNGKASRDVATSPKKNGKAGAVLKMPKSKAIPWTPFPLDGVKRCGVISDLHVPFHSEKALGAAVKHLKDMNPDCLLINGDLCDFYGLSKYSKNPRDRDDVGELHALRECTAWLRSCFPKARIVVKQGNHEARYDQFCWESHGRLALENEMSLPHWLHFEKYGVEYVTDQRAILVGKLAVFHGHELGKGISNPVNPARGAFLRAHDTVLVGHSHQTSAHADTSWSRNEIMCWSTGCLSDLNPAYHVVNRYNWGFANVDVATDGSFDVSNFRISQTGKIRTS